MFYRFTQLGAQDRVQFQLPITTLVKSLYLVVLHLMVMVLMIIFVQSI